MQFGPSQIHACARKDRERSAENGRNGVGCTRWRPLMRRLCRPLLLRGLRLKRSHHGFADFVLRLNDALVVRHRPFDQVVRLDALRRVT